MSKSLAIQQLLDCSEKEFWDRIFGSEDFNHYLYEGLGFKYELQEWNPDTGYRRAQLWPMQQMPRAVASVLGERYLRGHPLKPESCDSRREIWIGWAAPTASSERG